MFTSHVSPYTSFVLKPLSTCFTTEKTTVKAFLFVNYRYSSIRAPVQATVGFYCVPSYSYKLYNKSLVVERVSHQPCLDQSCARMDKTHLNFYSALAGIYK